jgi:uncharacterized protein
MPNELDGYAGGHAQMLGATDRRLRAVVAQAPTISGYEQGLRRISAELLPTVEEALSDDERGQLRGELRYQALVSADPNVPAVYRSKDAIDFTLQPVPEGAWENRVTLRSSRLARMYEPGAFAARVSPTPLLFVVARDGKTTPMDLLLLPLRVHLSPKTLPAAGWPL